MNRAASRDVQLVVEDELAEGAACLLHRRLRPEPGCQRLLGRPRRARARADLLDLVVVACPSLAVERRRSVGPELVGRVEAERPHQPEVGADRRRRRGREPDSRDRRVRRRIGHRSPEAVARAHGDQQSRRCLFADGDAVRLRLAVGDRGQRGRVRRIDDRRRLRRQVVDENAVGRRGHRRFGRGTRGRVDVDRERLDTRPSPPSPSRRPRSPRRRRSRGLRPATAPPP